MRRTLGVGVVLLLAVLLMPSAAYGQQSGGGRAPDRLRQNYPNPFNPTTRIPFEIRESDLADGKPAVVSIRIMSIFMQPVAVPAALNHPNGNVPVRNLDYTTPGVHEAYWDGLDRDGNKVGSGMYIMELVVNGERAIRKMVVAK